MLRGARITAGVPHRFETASSAARSDGHLCAERARWRARGECIICAGVVDLCTTQKHREQPWRARRRVPAEGLGMIRGMELVSLWARLIGPKDLTDRSILRFHRLVEYTPFVAALAAAVVLTVFDFGHNVDTSLMPTIAQVLPVLFLAQVVDVGFFAARIVAEVGPDPVDRELARRYVGISAQAGLVGFLAAEGAALFGVAYGATTFTVSCSIATGSLQALDLAFGPNLRGRFAPTALGRMVHARKRPSS
jgi:hypothetical protein